MTIKYSKEGTFWPFFSLSWMRFQNIQNNTHSILIVVSNYPFVCICSICSHNSILLVWTLWSINSRVKDLIWRKKRRKLLIFIRIINRIIDQILFDWRFILNNRRDLRVRRNFSSLKMFHYLSNHPLFSHHVLTNWFLLSDDAFSSWFSRSWNIDLIVLRIWWFSK